MVLKNLLMRLVKKNMFNKFFTSLASKSNTKIDDCCNFYASNLKRTGVQELITSKFKFEKVTTALVEQSIFSLDSHCGPGASGISIKILKSSLKYSVGTITDLINECISTYSIPNEWKRAVVKPLFKSGSPADMNNYRGISILPILAKVFEKILANQMIQYLKKEKLFFSKQFGFRDSHSCESALHDVISNMNRILSERSIGLYLFIDFRKAFDLVNSNILLYKLKHGFSFDDSSILLLENYFKDRKQTVSVDGISSDSCDVKLGIPQGSCLGPLLFLLFINDLPNFLSEFNCVLFADDTSLNVEHPNIDVLFIRFFVMTDKLSLWCIFNLLDINWRKTFVMFITNKRKIKLPDFIWIDDILVEVVQSFLLLGVLLDNKLNFTGCLFNF